MKPTTSHASLAMVMILVGGCHLRPAEERARKDLFVGIGEAGGVAVTVQHGLAQIRSIDEGAVELWAQSPVLTISLQVAATARSSYGVTIRNCMPEAELVARSGSDTLPVTELGGRLPTERTWDVPLPASGEVTIRVAPSDADTAEAWRFAVMGDVQEALPRVDEMFAVMNLDAGLRMLLSTGDLTESQPAQVGMLEEQLERLNVPIYATLGNHEVYGDIELWHERVGRCSFHFDFKGTAFSLVDSADGTIDPIVHGWLDDWLDAARDRVHVFLTHVPPFDPIGARSASFRSRKEASKLLARLAAGGIDITLYGHIHSFHEFENAGIPARISGGGGARPEVWDGIGRHYLAVEVSPDGVEEVAVVRVD